MKKLSILLATILLVVACGTDKGEKSETQNGDTTTLSKDTAVAVNTYKDPALPPSEDYSGDHIVKYKNGITRIRGFFRFGKKHGTWTHFFPTGEVQSETEYVNGARTGKIKVYYPNGKLMYEGEFKNDERAGTWKTYDESGKLLEEKKY